MRLFLLKSPLLLVLAIAIIGCSITGVDGDYSVTEYTGPAFSETDLDEQWDIQIASRTITLRGIPSRQEGSQDGLVMTIEDKSSQLPALIDLWYGPVSGGIGRKINEGRLEIQSWDLDKVISGAIHTRLPNGGTLYMRFWINTEEAK